MNDKSYFEDGKREIKTIEGERKKTPWEGDYLYKRDNNRYRKFFDGCIDIKKGKK